MVESRLGRVAVSSFLPSTRYAPMTKCCEGLSGGFTEQPYAVFPESVGNDYSCTTSCKRQHYSLLRLINDFSKRTHRRRCLHKRALKVISSVTNAKTQKNFNLSANHLSRFRPRLPRIRHSICLWKTEANLSTHKVMMLYEIQFS